ncbi:MAG: hypothetical protein ACYDCC_14215 [Actinomycetota bacterium]
MRLRGMTRLALVTMLVLAIPATSNAAGNLLPNPSFEQTALPSQVMDLQHSQGLNQPLLPVGWIFEGATELFDHTPNHHHTGQYSVAISGSWSTPRHECSTVPVTGSCTDVPGGDVRDTVYGQVYSVAPAWRTQNPVAVSAGKQYRLSVYTLLSIPKDGTGAVTRVRWLDANGVPIGSSQGPTLLAPSNGGASWYTFLAGATAPGSFKDHSVLNWTKIGGTVTAPAGAAGAIVLLGYTDDAWNGQVVYDDACFATLSSAVC